MELIFLALALGAFIIFQVFQGRKRKRETEDRQSKFLPGVEIMTNYGLYGTIVSIDDERNLVMLETSPGVEIKVHRQTILKVADYNDNLVESTDPDDEIDGVTTDDEKAVDGTPEFGERIDTASDGQTSTDRKPGDAAAN